jgi:hypothetical protein
VALPARATEASAGPLFAERPTEPSVRGGASVIAVLPEAR